MRSKVWRFILISLFFVLMLSGMLGFKMSLGTGLSIKNVYLYVAILGLLIEGAIARNTFSDKRLKRISGVFVVIVALAAGSWAFTAGFMHYLRYPAFGEFVRLKALLIDHLLFFGLYLYGTRTREDAYSVLRYMLLIIIFGNFLTFTDAFHITHLGVLNQRANGRVDGPLGESNQYGAFLILFIPAIIAWAIRHRSASRYIYLGGAFVSFIVLVLTGSRGALVGLVGGAFISLYLLRRFVTFSQVAKYSMILVPVLVAAVGLAAVKYSGLLMARFEQTVGAKTDVNVPTFAAPGTRKSELLQISAGRTYIWARGISMQAQAPETFIWGNGWDTFIPLVQITSHNTYLADLFELGIIGLALYLTLYGRIVGLAVRAAEAVSGEDRLTLTAFVFGYTSLLVSVFFVNLYEPWYFVWAYVALMLRVAVEALKASDAAAEASGGNVRQGEAESSLVATEGGGPKGILRPRARRPAGMLGK